MCYAKGMQAVINMPCHAMSVDMVDRFLARDMQQASSYMLAISAEFSRVWLAHVTLSQCNVLTLVTPIVSIYNAMCCVAMLHTAVSHELARSSLQNSVDIAKRV